MKKQRHIQTTRSLLSRFRYWGRKNYAAFASMGREFQIGHLHTNVVAVALRKQNAAQTIPYHTFMTLQEIKDQVLAGIDISPDQAAWLANMADSEANAVFRRAKLTDLLAEYGSDACQGMVLVPFKCNFDESDLTTEEYNLDGLLDYPVLADVGCIAINAGTSADGLKAAKSAALWLYSNGAGEDALTETLGVVTPWNTAAGTTAVTAMQVQQVGTGILPGVALDTAAADALIANELTLQDSEKHTKAERTAFVDGALAALGAE